MRTIQKLWATPTGKIVILFCFLLFTILLCYVGVEATSTPGFCGMCHEIQPAVESWKQSSHYSNGDTRANCRDCHVPPWSDPFGVLQSKIIHGAKDLYHHFGAKERIAQEPGYYKRLQKNALKQFSNDICLQCHQNILPQSMETSARTETQNIHAVVFLQKISCMTCHQNVGHRRFNNNK